jgi:hypothetical protein
MNVEPNNDGHGLTSQAVDRLLKDCLGGECMVEGIVANYGLDAQKLATHRGEIASLLGQLRDEFMDNGGGGWSFLNLCEDRHGRLWTGEHRACEALIVLGKGLDLADYLMPRDLWSAFPGGVPYIVVKRTAFCADDGLTPPAPHSDGER